MAANWDRVIRGEELVPATVAAERVLGEPVTTRFIYKMAVVGKNGRRLETIPGRRGQRMTTERLFRDFWVKAHAGEVTK